MSSRSCHARTLLSKNDLPDVLCPSSLLLESPPILHLRLMIGLSVHKIAPAHFKAFIADHKRSLLQRWLLQLVERSQKRCPPALVHLGKLAKIELLVVLYHVANMASRLDSLVHHCVDILQSRELLGHQAKCSSLGVEVNVTLDEHV